MKVVAALRQRLGKPGGIVRNILVLAGGTVMAKMIAFAAIPILTRFYSPTDFGVLALYVACVAFIVPFATFRYHVAIPLPRNDKVAVQILVLSLLLVACVTIFVALGIFVGGKAILEALSLDALLPYRGLIVIGVAGTAVYEIFQFWSLRKKRMKAIARTQILQSLTGSATKVALGLASYMPLGLLLGQILQQAGGIASLARQYQQDNRGKHPAFNLQRLTFVAKRYVGFPVTRLPSQFLLVAAAQIPILMTSSTFGADVAGQFALAFSTLAMPVSLIAQSVGNAFYAEIAKLGMSHKSDIRRLTHDVMIKLALLAIMPVAFIALLGPWVFSIVFGEIWHTAGTFAQSMSIYIFMQIVTSPVIHILTVLEKNTQFLIINFVRVALVTAAFITAGLIGLNALETVLLFSIVLAAHYAFVTVSVLRQLNQ